MKLYLFHVKGSKQGFTDILDVEEGGFIACGRDPTCQLRFHEELDISASSRHARIGLVDGQLVVEDTQSSYGTFVNGIPTVRAALGTKDVIRFGVEGPEVKIYLEKDLKVCPICDYPLLTKNFVCYACKRKVCHKHYDAEFEVCEVCSKKPRDEGILASEYLAALHSLADPAEVEEEYRRRAAKRLKRGIPTGVPPLAQSTGVAGGYPALSKGPVDKKTRVMGEDEALFRPEYNAALDEPAPRGPVGGGAHKKTRVMGDDDATPTGEEPPSRGYRPGAKKTQVLGLSDTEETPPPPPVHPQRGARKTVISEGGPPRKTPAPKATEPACAACGGPLGTGTFTCQGCKRVLCATHHYAGLWCHACVAKVAGPPIPPDAGFGDDLPVIRD